VFIEPDKSDADVRVQVEPTEVSSLMPDFAGILDVKEKKAAFVNFLLPAIEQSNRLILQEREFLLSLKPEHLSEAQWQALDIMALKYKQPKFDEQSISEWIQMLLLKVDVIPPSLALAQAANESAWGTSRFAKLGFNLYGQWCFSEGCGIVPSARPAGQSYEVRLFDSPTASVQAYMLNLNAFHTYDELRRIRQAQRAQNEALTGEALAQGLLAYSQRREAYIEEIQAMIRFNGWQTLDRDFEVALVEP